MTERVERSCTMLWLSRDSGADQPVVTQMPLPYFLCIGAHKAGTSWLYQNLRTHPRIWMPPIKEVHFFDAVHMGTGLARNRRRLQRAIKEYRAASLFPDNGIMQYLRKLASGDPTTEDWYRSVFDHPEAPGKMLGEVTPAYSGLPLEGVQHVRSLLGPAKIICIIRDPVSRAQSHLKMMASRRELQKPSQKEWLAMLDHPDLANRGAYSQHIPLWKVAFPENNLLFLPYQRIASEPRALLGQIELFLELEPHRYTRAERRIHASAPIAIPDTITHLLTERLAGERRYLQEDFGVEFASLT